MNKLMIRGAALFFLLIVSQHVFARGWMGAAACIPGDMKSLLFRIPATGVLLKMHITQKGSLLKPALRKIIREMIHRLYRSLVIMK